MRGFRIVACTKAPRLTALLIWHPDCAGVIPLVPVSWYGVARPRAVSGLRGTMMSQLTLAAAVVAAAAVADGARTAPPPVAALADGLAEAPSAVSPSSVPAERPLTAITTATTRPRATGIATATAIPEERFRRM